MRELLPFRVLSRRALLLAGALGAQSADPPIDAFFALGLEGKESADAVKTIERQWRNGLAAMLLDLLHLPIPPDHPTTRRIVSLLERLTRQRHSTDMAAWQKWAWALPYEPHPNYAEFKGMVLANVDPRMRDFFPPGVHARIRLDQVEWGGVRVNGIPPLVNPKHLAAAEARYLADGNVVFGIYWNGEARAYPKRILAWHEMARDRVGGLDLAIVYCTLCGTVIPYKASSGGRTYTLGTSGLLYESSKLMFDEQTLSLWPTLEGRPAIGKLAAVPDAQLPRLELAPVVTTTWGEWRRLHPSTGVLSLDTGHKRDYNEGAAYRDYFSTDRLMFPVSRTHRQLKAKDEVLVIRRPSLPPLAIAAKLLASRSVWSGEGFLILTSPEGANRVYPLPDGPAIVRFDGRTATDANGGTWTAGEDHLQAPRGANFPRVPAHRVFWFGWYAQFPDSVLIAR